MRWIASLEEASALADGPQAWVLEAGGEEANRVAVRTPVEPGDRVHAARRRGRQRTAAALERRRLLRAFAARRLGVAPSTVAFAQTPEGPPEVVAPTPVQLSSAAREGWTLLAASPAPIGADVERLIPAEARPLELFHPTMADRLRHVGEGEFTEAWSGAEAYLKLLGVGLAGLGDVVIEGDVAFWPGSSRPPARLARRWMGAFLFTIAMG